MLVHVVIVVDSCSWWSYLTVDLGVILDTPG
jgi:hypothetical protein